MASIFSETWTGSNGAGWPAQWTKSGSMTTDIQSNVGRVVSGTSSGAATAMRNTTALTATDYTGLVKVKVTNTTASGWYYFIHFRGSSTLTGTPVSLASSYELRLLWYAPNSSIGVNFYEINGAGSKTYRNGADHLNGTISAGDWVWLRWEVSGNPTSLLRYRLWKDGASEPGSWTNDWSASVVANNQGAYVALIAQNGDTTSEDLAFDSLDISTATSLTADFDVDVASPHAGAPVQFTDLTSPAPSAWSWDFGDGSSPVADSPSGQSIPAYDLAGWRFAQGHDFGTDHAVGTFGPHYDDVPAEFTGLLHVYEDDWRDTASSSGGNPALPSRYMPSQVLSCSGGMMVWHLFNEGSGARSAAVVVGGDQLYGRFEFCFKADALDGFKTAVLLWPDSDNWPHDGEIDFPEGALDHTIEAYMHRQDATSGSDQDFRGTSTTFTDWHRAVIEWRPGDCRFILDGVQLGATITSRVPNTPMHYVLQIESDLGGNQPASGTSGHLYCDWVARWTYDLTAVDGSGGAAGSTLQNPIHVYTEPGTYDVTLTSTLGGVTSQHTEQITVLADVTGVFGTHPVTGLTLQGVTVAMTGVQTVAAVTGTATVHLQGATVAATGTVAYTTVTGTLAATLQGATVAMSGHMGTRTVLVCPTVSTTSAAGGIARGAAGRLFGRFRGPPREASVLKIDGVYVTVSGPTTDQLAAATEVYLGGHVHELTPAQAAALTEAGYSIRVE